MPKSVSENQSNQDGFIGAYKILKKKRQGNISTCPIVSATVYSFNITKIGNVSSTSIFICGNDVGPIWIVKKNWQTFSQQAIQTKDFIWLCVPQALKILNHLKTCLALSIHHTSLFAYSPEMLSVMCTEAQEQVGKTNMTQCFWSEILSKMYHGKNRMQGTRLVI